MMKKYTLTYCTLVASLLFSFAAGQASAMQVSFMGRLANFEGNSSTLWSRLAVDKERTEVITLNPRQRDIRIYNATGMEVFDFGENVKIAGATDIDLGEDGDMYLVYPRRGQKLQRLDYKGEPLGYIDLHEIPADFMPFEPSIIQYMNGRLYLADAGSMDVVVTDTEGVFQKGYHLRHELLKLAEAFKGAPGEDAITDPEKFKFLDIFGLCVDQEGNIYFTIPVLFAAFKYTVDGEMQTFGQPGSAPGKFGVVAGINTDKHGNVYVSDRLRSVVMIFDVKLNFRTEFGYRGFRPGSLIVPDDVDVDDEKGLIYVAQAANRGVNVYRIIED